MASVPKFIRFLGHIRLSTIRQTARRAAQQRLPGLASEMAYNSMLALFPAILAVLTAIGLFKPLKETFLRLVGQLKDVVPEQVWAIIQGFSTELSTTRDTGLFSLSFAIALWAASGAFSAAMNALDQIHQIPPEKTRPFWKAKLISLGLTIGGLLFLLLALTIIFLGDLIVANIARQNDTIKPGLLTVWSLLTLPVTLGLISLTFGFIYRFGPSRWSAGRPIMPGAILAAIFWAVLSNLFRLYVSNFGDYNRAYGAIGAVIVLLLWLYLSSLVMLLGDQLNVTIGESLGEKMTERPTKLQRVKVKAGNKAKR